MSSQDPQTQQRIDALSTILAPRSVAIVGASDNAGKIGGIPLDYHKRLGFAGALYPVNPKGGQIQGLNAYPTLSAIGKPIDVAIVAVPSEHVPAALEDAISAGVHGVVLFTSGYAEISADGAGAQGRLADRARAAGVRLLGPNCLGFMNIRSGAYATFSPALKAGLVRPGQIGLVSQSGAFAAYAYALARERGIGLSQWITTGNEADLDFADCVEWLAHDPNTRVIMGYMEGCRDGFKLRRALAAAHAARKPVVIVKVGRTTIGAQAAASHTAALAGDDAVYDTVFREYGVHRARDVAEFFGIAASASIATLPPDRTIGLFTLSGGVGVLMADEAHDSGLEVRPMPRQAQDTIRAWVPFANPVNPVDITGQVTNDVSLIERSARLMLDVGQYGSWIGFMAAAGTSDAFWPVIESLVINLRRDFPDKLLALSTLLTLERRHALESRGCLVFSEPAEAVRTMAALATYTEAFARADVTPPRPVQTTLALPAGAQSEPQALATLAAAGISTCAHEVVASGPAAAAAAQRLAQPVVLKIVSPDILHKSDIGGVALGLRDADAVQRAYDTMLASVRARAQRQDRRRAGGPDDPGRSRMYSGCAPRPGVRAHGDVRPGRCVRRTAGRRGAAFGAGRPRPGHDHDSRRQGFRPAQRRTRAHTGRPGSSGKQFGGLVTTGRGRRRHTGQHRHQPISGAAPCRRWRQRRRCGRGWPRTIGRSEHMTSNTTPDSTTPHAEAPPRFALGQSIGLSAFIWAYPLIESMRTCRLQTTEGGDRAVAWRADIDRLQHVRRAATADDRDVVTPANDLLYTTGWFNLANGPRLLQVPSSRRHGGRYFVLALYDVWTNNFANPGSADSDADGETIVLVGPGTPREPGWPSHLRVVTSPTDLVWMIGRVVVGDTDGDAAQALQDDIRLHCPAGTDSGTRPYGVEHWIGAPDDTMAALAARPQDADAIAAAFFGNLCQCLASTTIPQADAGLAHWFTRGKLIPGKAFDWQWIDAPLRAGLVRGLQDGAALLESGSRSHTAKPWAASFALGRYGNDYLTRALTAYKGLGGLASDEAVYAMSDFDAAKSKLDGHNQYQIRFESGDLPPVDAFWSITLYAADRFLYPNDLQRFSIGDRTAGLRHDPDGGLTLQIGHAAPTDRSNWLPAPNGNFYLVLRMYRPRADARGWRIPPLQRTNHIDPMQDPT